MKKIVLVLLSVFALTTMSWAGSSQYLYFIAVNDSATIALKSQGNPKEVTLYYCYSSEYYDWTYYNIGDTLDLPLGDTLFFSAPEAEPNDTFSEGLFDFYQFEMTGSVAAGGNIMSLLDYTMLRSNVPAFAFVSLFENCQSLITPPELPATMLANSCYTIMFKGCSSLTFTPTLPARVMAAFCYESMFYNCVSLTSLPKLNATILANQCYMKMFKGCSKIKISTTPPGQEWNIPESAEYVTNWNLDMFLNTGGSFTGNPEIGVTYYVINDTTTDVEVVAENIELAIAPNPVRLGEAAQITVEDGSMVEVYNMNGQCVWQKCDTAGSVNVSGLNEAGVYVVKATKADGLVETGKLIIK